MPSDAPPAAAAAVPPLFPSLAEVAARTEALPDVADDDARLDEDRAALVEQAEGEEREMQEIESMCMRCHENGYTRLLLTTIPYFKEIIVSSFRCDNCGHRDTEIQSAGEIQPKGCNYTVHLLSRADLDRQLVKSNWATVSIPEFSLTIPPGRGQLTTIEGIIRDTIRDLSIDQPVRRVMDPDTAGKIDSMLKQLRDVLGIEEGEEDDDGLANEDGDAKPRRTTEEKEAAHAEMPFKPFIVTLDDLSGNSFIQFRESASDPSWHMRAYTRALEQNVLLGLVARPDDMPDDNKGERAYVAADHKAASAAEAMARAAAAAHRGEGDGAEYAVAAPDEVFTFPSVCGSCGHELETRMQQVNIPYFQDIIIMSSNCFACGYRDNEVKSGGAVPAMGKRITLKVEDEDDLSRDLLKSDTCGLEIPEIDLVLQPGTLGGRFTTLEGILDEIYTELSTKVFRTGDAFTAGLGQGAAGVAGAAADREFEHFLRALKECMAAARPFTLILDDPVANSYLQNLYAPDADPNMTTEEYERTQEQNDELGLSDMVVEGYNPDAEGTA
ncbi:nucleolar zinc-finger protein [Cryptotrichosporon argae]